MSFTEIKEQALRLRPVQRARLVSALIQTLDQDEEKPLTLDELDHRSEDLRSGRVQGIPAGEVLAAARKRIRS